MTLRTIGYKFPILITANIPICSQWPMYKSTANSTQYSSHGSPGAPSDKTDAYSQYNEGGSSSILTKEKAFLSFQAHVYDNHSWNTEGFQNQPTTTLKEPMTPKPPLSFELTLQKLKLMVYCRLGSASTLAQANNSVFQKSIRLTFFYFTIFHNLQLSTMILSYEIVKLFERQPAITMMIFFQFLKHNNRLDLTNRWHPQVKLAPASQAHWL